MIPILGIATGTLIALILSSLFAGTAVGKSIWGQAQQGRAQEAMLGLEKKKVEVGQEATRASMLAKQRVNKANWDRLERAQRMEREEGIERDYMQSQENAKTRNLQMAMAVLQSIMGQNNTPQLGRQGLPSIPEILRGA
jgi:hypothetical protein